jgi:PleD family two-component response regulator
LGQGHEQRFSQLQQADGLAFRLDALPAKMASLILRRQKHAHRQFLTAVQTLAIVRRFSLRIETTLFRYQRRYASPVGPSLECRCDGVKVRGLSMSESPAGLASNDGEDTSTPLLSFPSPPKVMMVDDEKLNSFVVAEYLRAAGFRELAYTTDPFEALPLAQRVRPRRDIARPANAEA